MPSQPLLRIDGVSKRFGSVIALRPLSLSLEQGRVYGLAGENGAGKSTLAKILAGVHPYDGGALWFQGNRYAPANPAEATKAGISVFHQEIPVCPNLSVAANVFLGTPLPGRKLFPDWSAAEQQCRLLIQDSLGFDLDPGRRMGSCTPAERQVALLARVLSQAARLIILDEPTTALSATDRSRLFAMVRRLMGQGMTFIFVSHLLDELMELCDEIFVLRDGALAGRMPRTEYTATALSALIAGRDLHHCSPARFFSSTDRPIFTVRDLERSAEFEEISFVLGPGEVLGLAGIQGSGRSSLARALFGVPPATRGRIEIAGRPVTLATPRDAIALGIGYVPEDRKTLGLFDDLDIQTNLGLLRLKSLSRNGLLSRGRLRELTLQLKSALRIKMLAPEASITSLSGGNQQKVLIGRWLATQPRILVMNEPTRGVDIAAKEEIYGLIRQAVARPCSFVIASSDLDELLQVTDRILVMNHGRITRELMTERTSKEELVRALGVGPELALPHKAATTQAGALSSPGTGDLNV